MADHRDIFDRRWPGLWETLASARPPRTVDGPTATPSPTLVLDGIHVTSGTDRAAEARLQASAVPPGSRRAWVYGLALGDIPRVLLSRPELERLDVVILSPAAAYLSLTRFDHRDWIEDGRVEVSVANVESRLCTPFAVAPACLKLAAPEALRLRDAVMLALAAPYQLEHLAGLAKVLEARVAANRPLIEADGDVASLFGSRIGSRAAVVAAGPTLASSFDWLSRHRADLTVIAVSTAVLPLLDHDIEPDLAVVVDHRPGARRHVAGLDEERLAGTPLVYAPTVDPEVLRAWPGPRLAASLSGQGVASHLGGMRRGELFCSGTVTHVAVDLAVRLGAAEVVLLGVDLCYPGAFTHVPGAAPRRERVGGALGSVWVVNGHGARVTTETNMVGYLRDLEEYVARHPGVRFVKRGRDGAAIEGVEWLDEDGDDPTP